MKEHEEEIPEDILDFIEEAKKEDELSIEISREDFFLACTQTYDFHVNNLKQFHKQAEIAREQIDIIQNLVNRSNLLEIDPDLRVIYTKSPNGGIGLAAEPKGEMGFKLPTIIRILDKEYGEIEIGDERGKVYERKRE